MSDKFKALLPAAQSGDMQAFAKLLTALEREGPASLQFAPLFTTEKPALRIGITGPPGAGKSTLIGEWLKELRTKNLKIGVLAVDPTSPITSGAILGDRIRYTDHSLDPKIFIRSLGTRGSLGGLSAAAYLMLRAFDACAFDCVLVETVGVGQVEVEIMNVADIVTVVLVPESGDSIQAMKAGILEIADVFVVNKGDRPGAESLQREIEASLALSESDKKVEVHRTSALNGQGTAIVLEAILQIGRKIDLSANRRDLKRVREEAKALMRARLDDEAEKRVSRIQSLDDFRRGDWYKM